ncbi:MAG: DUF3761 domain-containing protein [Thermoleophilia bacterium]
MVLALSTFACDPSNPPPTTSSTATTPSTAQQDTTPPQVTSLQPSGTIKTTNATASVSFTDSGTGIDSATANVYLDNVPIATCARTATSISCTTQGLAEGAHNITASVKDTAGNLGKTNGAFTVDSIAPAISSITPSGEITANSITAVATYGDAGSGINTKTVVVSLDGVPINGCTVGPATASCPSNGIAYGQHNLSVSVADLAGNAGTGSAAFSIPAPPPPPPPPPPPDPQGPTARCADGTLSYSQHRRGTCSRHGGVSEWLRNDIPS